MRLLDLDLRKHRAPLALPLLAFAMVTLISTIRAKNPLSARFYSSHLLYTDGRGRHAHACTTLEAPESIKPHTVISTTTSCRSPASGGLLGLAGWLSIWAAFLRRAGRIYSRIPPERTDDRALVTGSLAAVVGFLVAGLFEYSFGEPYAITLLWITMAVPFAVAPASDAHRSGAD